MKINGLYIGPYLEVIQCPLENIDIEYASCTNPECESHKSGASVAGGKFCHLCGWPVASVTQHQQKLKNLYSFVYYGTPELDGKFAVVEFPDTTSKYIIPNQNQFGYYDNQPDVIQLGKPKWQKALKPTQHPDILLLGSKLKDAGFEFKGCIGIVLDAEE